MIKKPADRLTILLNGVSMQVLITGGSGLIGSHLSQLLLNNGHTVAIVTRNISKAQQRLGNYLTYYTLDQLSSLDNFDAVVNLAGEPIADKRWSDQQKELLCQSRWQITQRLVTLFKASQQPPQVLVSGSAIGYYGSQQPGSQQHGSQSSEPITELSPAHSEFTHQLCQRWEEYALAAESEHTRVCLLRTGMVLSTHGGALAKMLPPFRLGLGGIIASGNQYISWIHIQDMVGAIYRLLTTDQAHGPFNLCAPNPVTNREFSTTLAAELHRPCMMPIPALAMRWLMGEAATLVVDGQRALPQRLQEIGYVFQFPTIEQALHDIITNNH